MIRVRRSRKQKKSKSNRKRSTSRSKSKSLSSIKKRVKRSKSKSKSRKSKSKSRKSKSKSRKSKSKSRKSKSKSRKSKSKSKKRQSRNRRSISKSQTSISTRQKTLRGGTPRKLDLGHYEESVCMNVDLYGKSTFAIGYNHGNYINIINIYNGELNRRLSINNPDWDKISTTSLIFSRDGLVTGHDNGRLILWDVENGNIVKEIYIGKRTTISRLAELFDGRIVAGCQDGLVRMIDLENYPNDSDSDSIDLLSINSDSDSDSIDLLSINSDSDSDNMHAKDNKIIECGDIDQDFGTVLALTSLGNPAKNGNAGVFASGYSRGPIMIWDDKGQVIKEIPGRFTTSCLSLSPCGNHFAAAQYDEFVFYSLPDWEIQWIKKKPENKIHLQSIGWNPNCKSIISGGHTHQQLYILPIDELEPYPSENEDVDYIEQSRGTRDDHVNTLYSPDGKMIITCSKDEVRIIKPKSEWDKRFLSLTSAMDTRYGHDNDDMLKTLFASTRRIMETRRK